MPLKSPKANAKPKKNASAEPAMEVSLESNLLPPEIDRSETGTSQGINAASKARGKARNAARKVSQAANGVSRTKAVLKKTKVAKSRNTAAAGIDDAVDVAAVAAKTATNSADQAAELADKSELASLDARRKLAIVMAISAKMKAAEIELAQANDGGSLTTKAMMVLEEKLKMHRTELREAEKKSKSAERKVSKLARQANVNAKDTADKAANVSEALKNTGEVLKTVSKSPEKLPIRARAGIDQTTEMTKRAYVKAESAVSDAKASAKASKRVETDSRATVSKARQKAKAQQQQTAALEAEIRETIELAESGADLNAPELYLNRELTWLAFNKRVLHEAEDQRTPLLERVKFLAIVGSNLDEFFMKRIGGLKQQLGAGVHDLTVDGRSPEQQIRDSLSIVREIQSRAQGIYLELLGTLRDNNIVVASYDELSDEEQAGVREYYLQNIFPLLTPLAMDPAHPFPHISNLSLNMLVTLHYAKDSIPILARVKVPVGRDVPRFQRVGRGNKFVLLEEIMANNLDVLFPDMEIERCEIFRVTRNANTERDEDRADDLLEMIEGEVRDRKFAPIVRLETETDITALHKGMLAAELGLDEANDVFASDTMLGMRDLFEIASVDLPHLHDPDHHPIDNVALQDSKSIFHIIREQAYILLQHPYESFTSSVARFIREASEDPKVMAIKMTLYRTSESSRIIEHLINAARNGKQVAVVVELKARFDEAANIKLANQLEEVGIHVTYGVLGLKTHSKLALVVRRDFTGLTHYAHIGTGNYHAGTARLYSDFGLLTNDADIGKDLVNFFNYLTSGCQSARRYSKILVSPRNMKDRLLAKIHREIDMHSKRKPGLIRFKTNALEDKDITKALYQASQSGVKVELIIRDSCRIRPGIPGLSDNVSVVSIVGRFLEHSRIYYFKNGGDEEFFIGSADLMMRNLERRAEVVVAIEAPALRKTLKTFLDAQISDRRNGWVMDADGNYTQRRPNKSAKGRSSQQLFIDEADRRNRKANATRLRKPRAIAKRGTK